MHLVSAPYCPQIKLSGFNCLLNRPPNTQYPIPNTQHPCGRRRNLERRTGPHRARAHLVSKGSDGHRVHWCGVVAVCPTDAQTTRCRSQSTSLLPSIVALPLSLPHPKGHSATPIASSSKQSVQQIPLLTPLGICFPASEVKKKIWQREKWGFSRKNMKVLKTAQNTVFRPSFDRSLPEGCKGVGSWHKNGPLLGQTKSTAKAESNRCGSPRLQI